MLETYDGPRGLTERVFRFPNFAPLVLPGGALTVTSPVNTLPIIASSGGEERMRLLALRGGLVNSNSLPLTGLELANLLLDISINGEEHLGYTGQTIPGQPPGVIPIEFDALFTRAAPWFFFACPPLIMHREALHAYVTMNGFNTGGEAFATLTPYLDAKIIDESEWLALFDVYEEAIEQQEGAP